MTTTPWPKAICFFWSRLVARAGRWLTLIASLVCAAWHDMVTYLRSWWRCVAPPLPTTRLHAAAYLLFPMQACWCRCGTHVCCVFALACCSFSWLSVVPHASPARHAWRPSYSSIPFCLLAAVVVSLHVRLYARAGIPFAPFRLLRKRACGRGVGTSRLRLVVTFYLCWRGCRSYLVFVA